MSTAYFVCPWFGIFAGGAERATRTLAIELKRRGWDIEILTTCSADLHADWDVNGFEPGLSSQSGLRVRRFELDQGRVDRYRDAVHLWTSGQPVPESSMYDFFRCGISSRKLIEYVGGLPESAPIIAIPYFHSLTFETIDAHPGRIDLFGCFHDEPQFEWSPVADMLRLARRVLFMAEEEKDLAIRTYGHSHGRRIIEAPVVGMGVEVEPEIRTLLASPDRMKELRGGLGVPDDYFISVGRKDDGKGLKRLLGWYSEYARQCPNPAPPLVFVGPGVPGAIPGSDAFLDLGFVSEAEKFALLEGAQGLINLSTNEAFSIVLMEAWIARTPTIVSSECPVTSGHVRRSAGGITVGDRAEFRAALATLRDQDLRRAAGEVGHRYVESECNWDRVTDLFARAVESN